MNHHIIARYPDLSAARAAARAIQTHLPKTNLVRLLRPNGVAQDKLTLDETRAPRGLLYGVVGGAVGGAVTGLLVGVATTLSLGAAVTLGFMGALLFGLSGFLLGAGEPRASITHSIDDLGPNETAIMIEVSDDDTDRVEAIARSTSPHRLDRLTQ